VRTVHSLRRIDVGFDPTNLMLFRLDGRIAGHTRIQAQALFGRITERLAALPQVRGVTSAEWPLLTSSSGFVVSVTVPASGAEPAREVDVSYHPIAESFFATYRIPIVAGRAFEAREVAANAKVAVVNQAFVRKYFGNDNPLGRHVRQDRTDREIVGVVSDLRHQDLRTPSQPTLYVPFTGSVGWFTLRTQGEPLPLLPTIRTAIHELDPKLPLSDVLTQASVIENNLLATERFFAQVAAFLGLVALALACVGLYGLMSYAVQRRTNEISIRMALGALPRAIAAMILRESLVMVGLGAILGIAVAAAGSRWIVHLLYGVGRIDPLTYAGGAIVLLAVAAFACLLPARRAAKVDPMVALRTE
jgi:predicted permease